MAKNKQKSSKPSAAVAASTNPRDTLKPVKAAQSIGNLITTEPVGISNQSFGNPVQPSKFSVTISVEFGTSS